MFAAIEALFALLEKPVGIAWFNAIKYSGTSLGFIPRNPRVLSEKKRDGQEKGNRHKVGLC
jgi:hypothetical protein